MKEYTHTFEMKMLLPSSNDITPAKTRLAYSPTLNPAVATHDAMA